MTALNEGPVPEDRSLMDEAGLSYNDLALNEGPVPEDRSPGRGEPGETEGSCRPQRRTGPGGPVTGSRRAASLGFNTLNEGPVPEDRSPWREGKAGRVVTSPSTKDRSRRTGHSRSGRWSVMIVPFALNEGPVPEDRSPCQILMTPRRPVTLNEGPVPEDRSLSVTLGRLWVDTAT